jgi:hypothetical protein
MRSTKLFILLLAFTFPAFTHAQFTPGRYILKLAENQKAAQVNEGRVQIEEPCPDYKLNCSAQIWDIKAIPRKPGHYYIQHVQSRKCITFVVSGTAQQVQDFIRLEPPQPPASMNTQSFSITPAADGKFIIQPDGLQPGETHNDQYLAGSLENALSIGSVIKIDNKNERFNPRNYANLSNIYWSLFSIPKVNISNVTSKQVNVLNAGSTVVTRPSTASPNRLEIDFKTGSDNFEPKDFQENLEIKILVNNQPDLLLTNANNSQAWQNNSFHRVSMQLPADINVDDLTSIKLARRQLGSSDNFKGMAADNWNLEKLTVTATIKNSGPVKRVVLFNKSGNNQGSTLFRFVYEMPKNPNEGTHIEYPLSPIIPAQHSGSSSGTFTATCSATFGTGGDNLEGGSGNNVNILIRFKNSSQTISFTNINSSKKWDNFSVNTVTKNIPNAARYNYDDIKEIELRHTGGGGIFADNWYLDKFSFSINIDGNVKIIIDRVASPIHFFTGDSRKLVLKVE